MQELPEGTGISVSDASEEGVATQEIVQEGSLGLKGRLPEVLSPPQEPLSYDGFLAL